MPEPTGPILRSLQSAHERRELRRRGELRTVPLASIVTPEIVEASSRPRDEWEPIGHIKGGGQVYVAPVGTPPPDHDRIQTVEVWSNPLLPPPIPRSGPLRRSILRDIIAAVATLTRSVFR